MHSLKPCGNVKLSIMILFAAEYIDLLQQKILTGTRHFECGYLQETRRRNVSFYLFVFKKQTPRERKLADT